MSTTTPEHTRIAEAPFGENGGASESQTAPPNPSTDQLDDVEKQIEHRTWKVSGELKANIRGQVVTDQFEREYTQKPLSYTSMMQFTGLLGRKIEEAMSGPEGLSLEGVSELADLAQSAVSGQLVLSRSDFAGIDSFVRGFAKLAAYVPEIVTEAQCIWLRVPLIERMSVQEIWGKPVDEGGMSMDDGEEMLTLFIRQNYEELERFFVERLRRIGAVIQKERAKRHPVGSPQ